MGEIMIRRISRDRRRFYARYTEVNGKKVTCMVDARNLEQAAAWLAEAERRVQAGEPGNHLMVRRRPGPKKSIKKVCDQCAREYLAFSRVQRACSKACSRLLKAELKRRWYRDNKQYIDIQRAIAGSAVTPRPAPPPVVHLPVFQDGGTPVRVADWRHAPDARKYNCARYDRCLRYAGNANWESWTCAHCKVDDEVEPERPYPISSALGVGIEAISEERRIFTGEERAKLKTFNQPQWKRPPQIRQRVTKR